MYDFHKDRKYYFDFILRVTRDYILPFINLNYNENSKKDILDIGCAEGAVLKAFTDQNCNCVGIELSEKRIELAHVFMKDEINSNKVKFISRDIYDIDPAKDIGHKFDLILLKDVIEHIFNQDKFFKHLPSFLKPNGQVFFAFPPWYMPFGGHQQVLR
ncbi:MAG: class I SAM-dependent methyltransferase, partial [Bacteroidia bacterium]|nr:class I SAM-dependent methyltransferase [Bacteroidia bacterium]